MIINKNLMGYFLDMSQFVISSNTRVGDQCDEMNDWTFVHLSLYLSLKVTPSYIIVLIV